VTPIVRRRTKLFGSAWHGPLLQLILTLDISSADASNQIQAVIYTPELPERL
jgi:hypothetical protein